MLKLVKLNYVFLALIMLTLTMALSACEERSGIPYTKIHSFEHKTPKFYDGSGNSIDEDLSSDELKPFMDGDIFFKGVCIRDIDDLEVYAFNIGVQFYSEIEGRKIFVEKMVLDTPNLKTERVINDFVDIDRFSKSSKRYWKRFSPLERISGDSIPLTAKFFMLTIYYRLDDSPTKQKSIRFDNASILAPVF